MIKNLAIKICLSWFVNCPYLAWRSSTYYSISHKFFFQILQDLWVNSVWFFEWLRNNMLVKPCTLKFCFYSSYIISNEERKLVFQYWICNSEGWGKGSNKNISCSHASRLLGLLVIVIFLPCLSGKRENVFANIIGEWHSYLYRIGCNMVINVWFSMWSNTFAFGLVLATKNW